MRTEAATADSRAGVVTTTSGKLNVRSSPSSGAAVVASLNKGSYVTLISKSGDWWKVEYAKGKYGYCHAGYITVAEGTPVTVAVSSGTLNVRSGAGTAYGKVGSLSKGERSFDCLPRTDGAACFTAEQKPDTSAPNIFPGTTLRYP